MSWNNLYEILSRNVHWEVFVRTDAQSVQPWTMIYAVISDIHANLEALEAVLRDFRRDFDGQIICLGDIVGYGADPEKCIERIRRECSRIDEAKLPIVRGNHDEAVCTGNVGRFNHAAAKVAIWTQRRLDEQSEAFLRSLPLSLQLEDTLLVHGSPHEPEKFHYIHEAGEIRAAFYAFPENIHLCFIGHTHMAKAALETDGGITSLNEKRIVLQQNARYLINPGSVGQPRDRDPRASYVVWDTEKRDALFRRVEYDVDTAQRKIIQSGLPEVLARRLSSGT